MASFTSVSSISSIDFGALATKFLRKQNVSFFLRICRYLLLAVALILPLLAAYIVIASLIESRGQTLGLEGRVQSIIDAAQDSPTKEGAAEDVTPNIVRRGMFGTLGAPQVVAPIATVAPKSPLSLTLIGTFLASGQEPYAIIEDKKKQTQDMFLLEQSVFSQATLKKIYQDRVEIERDGKIEILKLDDFAAGDTPAEGISASGDEFVVAEAEIDKGLENLPLLLTQARAVPYFKDGRAIGLRLFAIKSESLYERLGLKNGDILKSINGNSLGDLSQALKLFEQLKQERSIGLTLERDRQDREFKYSIR